MSGYKGNVNIHATWHKPTTPVQITVQYVLSSVLCPLDFSPFLHSHLVYISNIDPDMLYLVSYHSLPFHMDHVIFFLSYTIDFKAIKTE